MVEALDIDLTTVAELFTTVDWPAVSKNVPESGTRIFDSCIDDWFIIRVEESVASVAFDCVKLQGILRMAQVLHGKLPEFSG